MEDSEMKDEKHKKMKPKMGKMRKMPMMDIDTEMGNMKGMCKMVDSHS